MYSLEGKTAPDHTTIARFKSLHFSQVAKKVMAAFSNYLYQLGEVSGKAIFINGTKIEANANKYTFVWKKAVTKHMVRRLQKAADFVASCEELEEHLAKIKDYTQKIPLRRGQSRRRS